MGNMTAYDVSYGDETRTIWAETPSKARYGFFISSGLADILAFGDVVAAIKVKTLRPNAPLGKAVTNRMAIANLVIATIADCGRRFLFHKGNYAHFIESDGRVWYVDHYTQDYVDLHDNYARGFSSGGTMKALCKSLLHYIEDGVPLSRGYFGPWPEWMSGGDLWGYGDKTMEKIRSQVESTGIHSPQKKSVLLNSKHKRLNEMSALPPNSTKLFAVKDCIDRIDVALEFATND